ncbi:MAG: FecR domain-containing protein [Candidatus Omnitrophota bacterium]|nr:FecR domain-containing protein [Candidatus Omnitrophota bacterium]
MKVIRLTLMIILTLAIIQTVSAQDAMRTATIARIVGTVAVMPSQGSWTEARKGMSLSEGCAIRTKEGSKVILSLDGKEESALIEIRGDSYLTLTEMPPVENETRNTLLDLAIGDVLIKVKKLPSDKSKFEVRTPISYVGVRGTIFFISLRRVE